MDAEKNEIEIIDMDLEGRGIGKNNGKAVFVSDAVTGDRVTYEIKTSKKRYDIASLCEIVMPSPHRRDPECSSFGECGGCAFLNIDRTLELEIKRHAVESAFRRAGIGGIKADIILHGADKRYRNKAVFHHKGSGQFGFISSDNHTVSHCSRCLLVPEIFNKIIIFSEEYFSRLDDTLIPESIMLRIGGDDVMIAPQVKEFGKCNDYLDQLVQSIPQISSVYECIGYPTSYESTFRYYSGKKYIQTNFAGVCLNISPKSFFQVNEEIAELLCDEIASALSPSKGDTVLDLYCGIGTIALSIAKKYPAADIIGVEINESAIADAITNSEISGIRNASFICSDAGHVDFDTFKPYAIIVDPPRYGLSNSMIASIKKISSDKIVYMSCNPSTLAGDSAKIISAGYSIDRCIAADMFPRCQHVETVVIFQKQ